MLYFKTDKLLAMAGRPTVWSEEVSRKIEEIAALGASVEECAFYAGIHRSTLYKWMEEMPELKDRIQELQEEPILLARRTVVKSLSEPEHAKWYLERKKKKEFANRSELTGAEGKDLPAPLLSSIKEDNVLNNNSDEKAISTEEED